MNQFMKVWLSRAAASATQVPGAKRKGKKKEDGRAKRAKSNRVSVTRLGYRRTKRAKVSVDTGPSGFILEFSCASALGLAQWGLAR